MEYLLIKQSLRDRPNISNVSPSKLKLKNSTDTNKEMPMRGSLLSRKF
jgi:hypothetical protein